MREVKNTKNSAVLRVMRNDFIFPLLKTLIKAKINTCLVTHAKATNKLSMKQKNVMSAVFAIQVGSGKKRKSFGVFCNEVVRNSTLAELQALPSMYLSQAASLKRGNYSITPTAVPKSIIRLFKDVIYTELLDHVVLWKALGMAAFSRAQFHDNFMEDNDDPATCPYCDLDTINSPGSRFIEHFLPKSRFPLIALEARNLFSACSACNGPSGKLARIKQKVTAPYVKEIGLLVDFSFNDLTQKLGIAAKKNLDDVDGYLRLINLPTRYAQKTPWKQFKRRCEAITESVGNYQPSNREDLLAYVEKQQGGAVLTYAVRYWADATLVTKLTPLK